MSDTTLTNLVAWSVQAGLLTLAAAAAARLIPLDAPGIRYAWWRLVLGAALVLPLVQPWQPAAVASLEAPPAVVDANPAPSPPGAAAVATPPAPVLPVRSLPWPPIAGGVIVTGAVLRLSWILAGLLRLRRLRREGRPADLADVADTLEALHDAGADVRVAPALRQPVTFGSRHPVVLLPETLRQMAPAVQRAVLTHELWHVRRRDWTSSLLEEALLSVLWFHPAVWYLVSRVQAAREEVVDELSILTTNARRSYLEALLAFADEPVLYPAAPFAHRRQLFNRMMLISREAVMSSRRRIVSAAGMAGVIAMAGWYGAQAFPLTAAAPEPAAQQARDPRPGTPRPETSREQELRATTAAEPSNVSAWLELARHQAERGANDEAETTYRAALAATGSNREVLLSMARFYNTVGGFEKSVEAVETAAAQNPTDPTGHQLVATWYWEKAQKDTSLTAAEKLHFVQAGLAATDRALAQNPDYIEALTYKNILLRMQSTLEPDATRKQALLAEADVLRNRAIELNKARQGTRPAGASTGAPPPPPPPPPPSQHYVIDGQQAVRVGGDIKPPTKIKDVKPDYPQEAFDAGVSGQVIIEVAIDTAGHVRSTFFKRSIPALDKAAEDAVRQWQFTPTVIDGVPVPVIMTVTVNFTIGNSGSGER